LANIGIWSSALATAARLVHVQIGTVNDRDLSLLQVETVAEQFRNQRATSASAQHYYFFA
jgi:hypothetical protein